MTVQNVRTSVDRIFDEIVALRRDIHAHPDLSEQETRTMELVSNYLSKLGIPHETNVGGHGVVAIIGDPAAKLAVAIRADMDALPIQENTGLPYASQIPGVMHACGHDIHTAALLGTAKILKELETQLPGAVKLFFQPAEETIGGAKPMIAAGCLQNPPVKHLIGFHVDPSLPLGKVKFSPGVRSASSSNVTINVKGRSSHGAQPEDGVDAILAASHIVTALQSVSSRIVSPTEPIVLTIGKFVGGTKSNIVAGEVKMEGTLRTLSLQTLDSVKKHIRTIAQSTAEIYGATAEVDIFDKYHPVVNNADITFRIKKVTEDTLGAENVLVAEKPILTSEDVSFFLDEVPGTFFDIGTTVLGFEHPQVLHSGYFSPDEESLRIAIQLEVLSAWMLLKECAE